MKLNYHIIDSIFGIYGSNNDFNYTGYPDKVKGPPHDFPLFMGSDEEAPMRRINWSIQDIYIVFVLAVIIFFARKFIVKYILVPISNTAREATRIQKLRFIENAWFFVYYTIAFIFGYIVLSKAPWFHDTKHCAMNYPYEHTGDEVPYLRLYMLFGCAFYSQALFSLLFVDEKMKDFLEMVVHHIATISLIAWCLIAYHHRIGSLVLILHDFVDVFLYIAKALHHLHFENGSTILFLCFTVCFILVRLVYFPVVILLAAANFQGWDYAARYYFFRYVKDAHFPIEISDYGSCLFRYCVSSYWALTLLLCLLVVLHAIWLKAIVRVLYGAVVGANVGDPREEDEEELAEENKKEK
ncbi:hypothetical protein ABK040_001264 [Willaertia magna]